MPTPRKRPTSQEDIHFDARYMEPRGDRVLLRRARVSEMRGGLFVPDSVVKGEQGTMCLCEVLKIGPEVKETEKGWWIWIAQFAGTTIQIRDEDGIEIKDTVVVIREADILLDQY